VVEGGLDHGMNLTRYLGRVPTPPRHTAA
jgi:hypothetical protein